MSDIAAARFLVSGRVQGVGFRAQSRRRALALALAGHSMNLPDGTVEIVAQGRPDALERFAAWLKVGPPSARVDDVLRFSHTADVEPAGFRVR